MNAAFFTTKAQVLLALKDKLSSAKILPLFYFTVAEYRKDQSATIEKIRQRFSGLNLIIRSSSIGEDSVTASMAGKFCSILNVDADNQQQLTNAIQAVIDSYDDTMVQHEVLVQPMLTDVILSGVAFSVEPNNLSPYYVINYVDSHLTTEITDGTAKKDKRFICYRRTPHPIACKRMQAVIALIQELETITQHTFIDVEFAFDESGQLYLFQVRPIVTEGKTNLFYLDLRAALKKIEKKVEKLQRPHPNLLGHKTLFGVMPDWNPAEIIGLKPRSLSLSLYQDLVTDAIWAKQRFDYSYQDVLSHRLMSSFIGLPFIDVRVDFNSWLPRGLPEALGEKLVNYYLDKMSANMHFHDKIEFEIVFTCYTFDTDEKLHKLLEKGFSTQDIECLRKALLAVTNNMLRENGLLEKDAKKIAMLGKKYRAISQSQMSVVEKIYWLMEDCKHFGTLPFAGIARCAFVAVDMLNSLQNKKIFSSTDAMQFMASVDSVATQMRRDCTRHKKGEITESEFLAKYGHLRPNTYDILSTRYDQDFEHYFSLDKMGQMSDFEEKPASFILSENQKEKLQSSIQKYALDTTVDSLITFMQQAIRLREQAKLIFTRHVSLILELIAELGERNSFSREEMAFANVKTIKDMYYNLEHRTVRDVLLQDIQNNSELYQYTTAILLPHFISSPEQIYAFYAESLAPNFVTNQQITAGLVVLGKSEHQHELNNKIIFIESADPGYEFLFAKDIGGLITKFGGVNSHMAIRCSELNIPAIIGVGELNFDKWSKAKMLEINCATRQVSEVL